MAKSSNIKKSNVVQAMDVDQVTEVKRCMYGWLNPITNTFESGPVYFAKNYVRIQHPTRGDIPFALYDYQVEMLDLYLNNNKTIILSARQTGKCLTTDTTVTTIVPLPHSFINTIKKFMLKMLDRDLYDKLYGKNL